MKHVAAAISASDPPRSADGASQPEGRSWFPLYWPALLAAVVAGVWLAGGERGVFNTVLYVSAGLALVGEAWWIARRSGWRRPVRWALAVLVLLPCAVVAAVSVQWAPIQFVFDGDMTLVGWRWRGGEFSQAAPAGKPATVVWRETPHDYPKFLGTGPWAEARGVRLETDWDAHPPRLAWKQAIGAGWSGFAVVGDYAITQEQRGDEELVVCYEVATGEVAWTHADPVRWDPPGSGALGGVGPRATPTVHEARVFTHGATGIVNCLNARTGERLWSHDTLDQHETENVMWGKAGSPLVVDDQVIVSVGAAEASLVAYDIATGEVAWTAGGRRSSYATPVLAELAGVRQILVVNEDAVTAHRAEDGAVLWEHPWLGSSDTNASSSQPVPVGDDRVLLSKGYGEGAELIAIAMGEDGRLSSTTVWKNQAVLRTKMCNVVVRDGYAYGLNDGILQCVDLATGESQWKKRRTPKFGHGQIMLVGDVLLALSELGEVILAEASPRRYRELAAMQAIEGVTWNNPALAGRWLLVRNAEQAACFELPLRDLPTEQAAAARVGDPLPRRVFQQPVFQDDVLDVGRSQQRGAGRQQGGEPRAPSHAGQRLHAEPV